MHQSSQGHLAKDKNSYIVPEMICRVFGNSKNMFMIHSIEVKLASQPRSTAQLIQNVSLKTIEEKGTVSAFQFQISSKFNCG